MKRINRRIACGITTVLSIAFVSRGQVPGCAAGTAFPAPAITRAPNSPMTASDMYLAVSPSIIAMTTNDKVQLRCRSGGGLLTGTPTFPMRGPSLASGLFVTNPPDDADPTKPRRMFDPRIIYDNYDSRFWIVASEDGTAPDGDPTHTFDVGRIHLMASKTSSPQSWSGASWFKCTWGVGADKEPLDIQTSAFGDPEDYERAFPDRCSIGVDKEYVYITYREGKIGPNGPPQLGLAHLRWTGEVYQRRLASNCSGLR